MYSSYPGVYAPSPYPAKSTREQLRNQEEVLVLARSLIEDPKYWIQGRLHKSIDVTVKERTGPFGLFSTSYTKRADQYCLIGAVNAAVRTLSLPETAWEVRRLLMSAIKFRGTGFSDFMYSQPVEAYNDTYKHKDVLKVIDIALEMVRTKLLKLDDLHKSIQEQEKKKAVTDLYVPKDFKVPVEEPVNEEVHNHTLVGV